MAAGFNKSSSLIKTAIIIFLFLLTAIIFYSCDNSVEPEIPPPGRSDYVWEIDTISDGTTSLLRIWGTDSLNLWAGGTSYIGGGADIFHFGGEKWSISSKNIFLNLSAFTGKDEYNIWACGNNGLIYFYDGNRWKEEINVASNEDYFHDIELINDGKLLAVGGEGSDDYKCLMYEGNAGKWKKLEIGKLEGQFSTIHYSPLKKIVFLKAATLDTSYIYTYTNVKVSLIRKKSTSKGILTISRIGKEVVIIDGKRILKFDYNKNTFNEVMIIGNSEFIGFVRGRNLNDLFLGMKDGIVHYNGQYTYLFQTDSQTRFNYSDGIILDDFCAFLFWDSSVRNIIYRGQLE